jgi:gustatory receptor
MAVWHHHEKHFLLPPYADKISSTYMYKMWFVAFGTIVLTIFDHYVYFISAVENTHTNIEQCEHAKRDFWRILFVNERQVFFLVIPYHSALLPFLEWYEVVKQVCWTYSEVLVSCMSIALATRFRQLTNRLKFYEKHHLAESFWNEIREHYNIICNLVLKADDVLSPIIITYSFANLFFICQKIFMQFERKKMPWDRYYSFYSAIFLICRTMWMLAFGAGVNERSREVLQTLREVPSETFEGVNVTALLNLKI